MNNKIENEFKPRTWLLIVLIVIALGISVVLINKIVTNRKEKTENRNGFFNNIIEKFNERSNVFDGNKEFNDKLEFFYEGTQSRTGITNCLDEVLSSNKKNPDHLITVCYQNDCTSDDEKIRTIKKNFSEYISTSDPNWSEITFKKYDVIFDYDSDGYINKVTIEE